MPGAIIQISKSVLSDENHVLNPDAEGSGDVDARLHGDHHAGPQKGFVGGIEPGLLMNFQAQAPGLTAGPGSAYADGHHNVQLADAGVNQPGGLGQGVLTDALGLTQAVDFRPGLDHPHFVQGPADGVILLVNRNGRELRLKATNLRKGSGFCLCA